MQAIPKTSRELENAIADDKRRQAIDAAKKRAVAQKADYDTFRNMVLTAHLKPIQAPSAPPSGPRLPAWGLDASGSWMRDAAAAEQQQQQQQQQQEQSSSLPSQGAGAAPIPASAAEFQRAWARLPAPPARARWRYLRAVGAPALLPRLFRVELPPALLGGVAEALEAGCCAAEADEEEGGAAAGAAAASAADEEAPSRAADFARETIAALKGCGRFDLAVRLQNRAGRDAFARLVSFLDR